MPEHDLDGPGLVLGAVLIICAVLILLGSV